MGCARKKEVLDKRRIVTPHQLADIPLPLYKDVISDISFSNNSSILTFKTDFSLQYLKKFYCSELDQMGWLPLEEWAELDGSHVLLFEQMHQRLLIRFIEQHQQNLTQVTLYRTTVSDQNLEV